MADETHKLQKDPPEGSRKVIEHELERQSDPSENKGHPRDRAGSAEPDDSHKGGGGGSR